MKNNENINFYLKVVNKWNEAIIARDKAYYTYIRSLSQMLVGLLGILIALRPTSPLECIAKLLFLVSITLIGLTILFSQKLLFSEVKSQELEVKAYHEKLKTISESDKKVSLEIIEVPKLKNFSNFEKMTFFCFVTSIIVLIIYTYVLILQ
ncbi:hypothetical protein [Cellulophaga baltica]|uniref:hypothetical protein n=1 Tax=Cellulophaga baltica TaxID=76594 RepID=UPI0015F35EAD|nr:hypothetical protein [Cellulophaga baltica]MBA6316940.1 hypothetical protein [Cellulophaga baltica]